MTSVAYKLQNAYIWGDTGWQPWANTLLYMPLNSDLRDLSSYNRTASITNGTISYSTIWWVNCAYPTSTWRINIPMTDFNNTAYTESIWVYATWNTTWKYIFGNKNSGWSYIDVTFVTNDSNGNKLAHYWNGDHFSNTVYTTWEWKLITVTKSWNTVKMYQNWVQFYTYSYSGSSYTFSSIDLFSRSDYWQQRPWYAADFVVEKVCWTDDEVLNYYNSTKSKYAGWEPDATRTMLYLKFENDCNDSSGNNVSVTWTSVWYWTIWNNHYATVTDITTSTIKPPQTLFQAIGSWDFTISLYAQVVQQWSWWSFLFWTWYDYASPRPGISIKWWYNSTEAKWFVSAWDNAGGSSTFPQSSKLYDTKTSWHNVIVTRISSVWYLYIDWELIQSTNWTTNMNQNDKFYILNRTDVTQQRWTETWAKVSEVIVEKVWWSAEKCVWYFNSTKSNYWF